MKKNKLNDRKRTFLLITIPIVALFFCFNTLPLIKGVIYSFTNFKGYGNYDWVGLRIIRICLPIPESEAHISLHLSWQLRRQF